MALRIVSEPPVWLATDTAIYIGIVYSYLPFMVLPLYATLEKMDETLLEAAADLGCRRWSAFWRVTFPLSASGMLAGALVVLHPDRRRVRHSRSARRLAVADDRADDLDGIFRQQGLAGGLRGRHRAGLPAGDADRRLSAPGHAGGASGTEPCARSPPSTSSPSSLGIAFLYLPIAVLVVYSFNASRLVAVWGGWSTRWYARARRRCAAHRFRAHQHPPRAGRGERGDAARDARGAGARAFRPLPRPAPVCRDDLCAAGHAGGDHRIVAAPCCSSPSPSTAASGRSPSPTPPWRCASSPSSCSRASSISTAAWKRRRWISAPRRCAPSLR